MRRAETVLSVLRERGRRGLPVERLYRMMFNRELFLMAYGRIYSNQGAMTPGATRETADGMSMAKIDRIIDALRHERYRFAPARRIYIPKKNGKLRPLGLPTWSDKLVGEVIRLILEAYYEPRFSDRSTGFVLVEAATPHCVRWRRRGLEPRGSSKVTSPTVFLVLTTRSWSRSYRRRCTITGSCD
jgi:hypothetical protein